MRIWIREKTISPIRRKDLDVGNKIESFNKLDHNFIVPNKKIIIFKEAIVFGFLGLLRYLNKKNIDKSVTGSSSSSSSGLIVDNKLF